jgi:GT2 family glycosyltransferase
VAVWIAGLRSFGVDAEHVLSSERGRAAALNRGLERVSTRFVAVTDDDCFVEPDWLRNLVARLRETPNAIITGRMEPEGDEPVVAVSTSRKPAVHCRPQLKNDSLNGGDMGVPMAVIECIGMFDEDPCLSSAEDREYSYRALRSGVQIVYAPEVVVRHFGWRNAGERAAQYQNYARSHGGFYGKYLRRGDWFIALQVVIHLLRALRRWLRGVITTNRELCLSGRAYLTGLLPGIVAGWRNGRSL